MITVRQAAAADVDQLAALNHAFNGVERSGEAIGRALQANDRTETVLVADVGGTLAGFLCLQTLRSICYDAPWAEITELYVAPPLRGQGVGEALVCAAVAHAESAGASELLLRTNEANAAAQRLGDRVGLERAPHRVYRRVFGGGR